MSTREAGAGQGCALVPALLLHAHRGAWADASPESQVSLKKWPAPFREASDPTALWVANDPLGKQTSGQELWVMSPVMTTAGCECRRRILVLEW